MDNWRHEWNGMVERRWSAQQHFAGFLHFLFFTRLAFTVLRSTEFVGTDVTYFINCLALARIFLNPTIIN